MRVKDVANFLDNIAPAAYQESYDNAGLIVGNMNDEVHGVLVCLDSIEETIEEAKEKNCNLIVAHHPILFSPLKKLNGASYIERTIIKAIQNNIAIYAVHTNLDNMYFNGVNTKICEKIGIKNYKILAPKYNVLRKLVSFAPVDAAEKIRNALFGVGAGVLGDYDECSFNALGMGTFKGNDQTNPSVGEKGKRHHVAEMRIEITFPIHLQNAVKKALIENHPYEEVAYDIYDIKNEHPRIGAGIIGDLEAPMSIKDFLKKLKEVMNVGALRYTHSTHKKVQKIAVCGGAGSEFLKYAIQQNAEVYISADFKYHQFFDAEKRIVIADIGHYESEFSTIELLHSLISQKFPNFAVHMTQLNTNPVSYL